MGKKRREKKARRAPAALPLAPELGKSPTFASGTPTDRAELRSGDTAAWYVTDAERAEQLLVAGHLQQARSAFEWILSNLGERPDFGRAAILGRLGRCHHLEKHPNQAIVAIQQAIQETSQLNPTQGVMSLRGTLYSSLGETLRAAGQYAESRHAQQTALAIAEQLGDIRAQVVDLGQLGALAQTEADLSEARRCCESALSLLSQIPEPAMEAAIQQQLGLIAQQAGQHQEAEHRYLQAARLRERHGLPAHAAEVYSAIAKLHQDTGNAAAAESWYRKAIDSQKKAGFSLTLARHMGALAKLLTGQGTRLAEARALAQQAVVMTQGLDATAPEVWEMYGILATIIDREAAATADPQDRALLQSQSQAYRDLELSAPRIIHTLRTLSDSAGLGRAVLLGRLGQCYLFGRRPDLAIPTTREAMRVAARLSAGEQRSGLIGKLQLELGDALFACDQIVDAGEAYMQALSNALEMGDLCGQAIAQSRLGALAYREKNAREAGGHWRAALASIEHTRETAMVTALTDQLAKLDPAAQASEEDHDTAATDNEPATAASANFTIKQYLDSSTDYVFDTDLFIDGRRTIGIVDSTTAAIALGDHVRPMLLPCTRTYLDDRGALCFSLNLEEPAIERCDGCTVMRRIRREIAVTGNTNIVWQLIRLMDGSLSVGQICHSLASDQRLVASDILAALAAAGAIDVSNRTIGRFLHSATKKGVVPGGGLGGEEVMQLATDGHYREYAEMPRLPIKLATPERLQDFHRLTRQRRSQRDYQGLSISREELDALLYTACGVTGSLSWSGREVKLRAYPASGALYAVEIYPIVMRVDGLAPAIYHYRPIENVLELIRPDITRDEIVGVLLPVEREMVAGASAMICLAGSFLRHERKYGQGGYRMMVAEAGHISENLVLTATALGLGARPFGGVFDSLINAELRLEPSEEQFLLSVLIGHTGATIEQRRRDEA